MIENIHPQTIVKTQEIQNNRGIWIDISMGMVRNCNAFFFLNLVFGICISLSVQNKPIMSEVNMHDLSSLLT